MVKKSISKRITALLLAALMLGLTGCGSASPEVSSPDEVALIDPVGVSYNYEVAELRTIVDAETTGAFVAPAVTEYSVEVSQSFNAYDIFPGGMVNAGEIILHGNTESLEEQIKNKRTQINESIENYDEQIKDYIKSLEELVKNEKDYTGYVNNSLAQKPAETIIVNGVEVPNPDYNDWFNGQWGYNNLNMTRIRYSIDRETTEFNLKKLKELFALDLAHDKLLLNRLIADRKKYSVISTVTGAVVAMQSFSKGDWVNSSSSVAAVGDLSQKEIRCEYISKAKINKAKEVYAVFNGKKYEVEYVPIETEEYTKINEANGKVLSTFKFKGDSDDIVMGQAGVIIRINNRVENVVTVPRDAVKRDEGINYVYLLVDGSMVYTPVTVGAKDGAYAQIVSGVEVGDKVITESAVKEGKSTMKIGYGTTKGEFSGNGQFSYPDAEWITNPVEYGTTYFIHSDLNMYQTVNKGDVICTIKVIPDTLTIQRKEQTLKRTKDRLEDYIKENEELLKKDPEKDETAKRVQQAVKAKEESIADQEEIIEKMKSDALITEIKAPYDGIIIGSAWKSDNSLMNKGDRLFQIANKTASYIVVEDPNGQLNYGDRADISYEDSEGKAKVGHGTVVTINPFTVSKGLQIGYALIRVDDDDVGPMSDSNTNMRGWWGRSNFKVKVTIRKMENVLVVPRTVAKDINGSHYVKVKEADGTVKYVGFVAGGQDSTNYWVAEGLTEGMEICLE